MLHRSYDMNSISTNAIDVVVHWAGPSQAVPERTKQ